MCKNVGENTKWTALTCSISYKKPLPPEELGAILSGEKELAKEWLFHFSTLFNEVPHDYIADTMKELGLSLEDVNRVYNALPPLLRGNSFKEFQYDGWRMDMTQAGSMGEHI